MSTGVHYSPGVWWVSICGVGWWYRNFKRQPDVFNFGVVNPAFRRTFAIGGRVTGPIIRNRADR